MSFKLDNTEDVIQIEFRLQLISYLFIFWTQNDISYSHSYYANQRKVYNDIFANLKLYNSEHSKFLWDTNSTLNQLQEPILYSWHYINKRNF